MLNLSEIRKEKGFTQKEFAKLLGISAGNLCEWEKGRIEPNIEFLKKIAKLLECSVDYLLGLEDDFGNIVIAGESDGLTEEEKELIKCYRSSADAERLALITTARSFAKRKTDAKHSVG